MDKQFVLRGPVAQVRGDQRLCFQLAERALGNANELGEFFSRRSCCTFRQIAGDRDRSAAHLRSKTVQLVSRKLLRDQIHCLDEAHSLPPGIQALMRSGHPDSPSATFPAADPYAINDPGRRGLTCPGLLGFGFAICESRFTKNSSPDLRFTIYDLRGGR
jgi:hypothetical protein